MHPFVKILSFIFILLLMNFLGNQLVWLLCLFVCVIAARLHFEMFVRVVQRMRWLFISIGIIYAFGTPGEYIQYFPANFSPTFEGVALGFLQIAKLLTAVASLSMLFASSSKEHLMAGLYILLSPLNYIGFNVQRFTARLLLTLDYVDELAVKKDLKTNFYRLDELPLATDDLPTEKLIFLQQHAFKLSDKLMIIVMLVSALVLLMPSVLLVVKFIADTKWLS